METKDFEKALPQILFELGIDENGSINLNCPVVVKVPDGVDFKSLLMGVLEKSCINIININCKIETPLTIIAKMKQAGWCGIVSSSDIMQAESAKKENVSSILLIDHLSDINNENDIASIAGILKDNKENDICGTMNIPVIVTFSKDEGMDYFYRNTSIPIIDERYWK